MLCNDALVETSHGTLNLIQNEYACYRKEHIIHSSGQIKWFISSVDDRSVQVGRQQRICTIDGCPMPLVCRSGLIHFSLHANPSTEDLERYQAVNLTGPNEWDPSVLDYSYQSDDGEPTWSTDPNERFALDPNFDEFGDYAQRVIQTLNVLDDSSQHMTPLTTTRANQHILSTNKHVLSNDTPDYEKLRSYFGCVNVDSTQETIEQSTQWGVSIPTLSLLRKTLSLETQHLISLCVIKLLLLTLSFLIHLQ